MDLPCMLRNLLVGRIKRRNNMYELGRLHIFWVRSFWKKRKTKVSIYINVNDASNGMKGLTNLEKGCKIDLFWNKFSGKSDVKQKRCDQIREKSLAWEDHES